MNATTALRASLQWSSLELRAPYPETALLLIRPHVAVLEGGAMTYVVARPKMTH